MSNDIFNVTLQSLLLISRVTKLDFFYFAQEDFAVGVVVCIPILQVFPVGHHSDRFTGWAVLFCPLLCGREPLASYVGLYPKVGEEEEEEDAVHPNEVDPKGNLVVTLFHEVVLADVNGDQNKLRLSNNRKGQLVTQIHGEKLKRNSFHYK